MVTSPARLVGARFVERLPPTARQYRRGPTDVRTAPVVQISADRAVKGDDDAATLVFCCGVTLQTIGVDATQPHRNAVDARE